MATLTEYFDGQAREMLIRLERGLSQLPVPDTSELYRAARELRGTAHLAREDRMYRAIGAFEAVARALAENALDWSEDMAEQVTQTIGDLRALLDRQAGDETLEARVEAAVSRWSAMDVGGRRDVDRPASADDDAREEFREFAARELEAIIEALEAGVRQMAAAPMDREPLRMILRRQRALLGAARLDEVPVVAEILRAIEDLTRVIAKLDVGVKQEWLGIYRVAQDALRGTLEPLRAGEDPQPSHALSRLRHMREELLDRYGAGEAVSAAHESEGLVQAQPGTEHVPEEPASVDTDDPDAAGNTLIELADEDVVELSDEDVFELSDEDVVELSDEDVVELSDEDVVELWDEDVVELSDEDVVELSDEDVVELSDEDVVAIDDLLYRRDAALERALELRGAIDRVVAHDAEARAVADELFDLIRLAQG